MGCTLVGYGQADEQLLPKVSVFQYKVVIQYKVIGINASITSDEPLVQVSYVSIVLLGQGVSNLFVIKIKQFLSDIVSFVRMSHLHILSHLHTVSHR